MGTEQAAVAQCSCYGFHSGSEEGAWVFGTTAPWDWAGRCSLEKWSRRSRGRAFRVFFLVSSVQYRCWLDLTTILSRPDETVGRQNTGKQHYWLHSGSAGVVLVWLWERSLCMCACVHVCESVSTHASLLGETVPPTSALRRHRSVDIGARGGRWSEAVLRLEGGAVLQFFGERRCGVIQRIVTRFF